MKNKVINGIIIIISVALAALCGYYFCTKTEISSGGLPALIAIYIVSLFVSALIIDILHEVGHFFVGLICKMGVKMPKISLFSSSSVDLNPKNAKHIKGKMLATTLAGCAFTLIPLALGIISLAVPSVPIIFCVFLPFSCYHILINIIPQETSNGKTDGKVAWEIITNQPTAKVMLAILHVQGLVNSGTNLKDVSEAQLMDLPQLVEDDVNFIILTQLRYEYYLAKGDDSTAYKFFSRYKDLIKYLPEGYKKGNGKKQDNTEKNDNQQDNTEKAD